MSKKVDERVVEMRFDNQQFESATKQTMSTLDKLKAALKFPSSTKSLESVSKAAKNVDFSGMSKGIETVNARFSAMQVVGMTALANITSAAMRAGTNMVKSLTLDPVIGGFQEYETQLNAVQTILSNTKSKGSTIEDVTAALDELNEYADLTIYNFTEMTRNIGTFTAAGVGLEESVSAIKGIANLAAASGSSSAQASTAMYQLSQALAAGRVSLMDWNSVVNAGMGGELFQNALIRTAQVMGTGVDAALEKYGTFRESLTKGEWLTADVLTETLSQIAGAYDEAELRAKGYNDTQIAQILDLADTATKAATEIKTFTQLMGTVSEAIGSGWAKTWQLVFGDFEEAKSFWTNIWNGTISPMIENMSNARNAVIEGAMDKGGSRWGEFTAEIEKAGLSVDAFQAKLGEVYKASSGGRSLDDLITQYGTLEDAMGSGEITASMVTDTLTQLATSTDNVSASTQELAKWQKVVDDVWFGTYGNIDTGRMEKLAAAGWEYAEVQKLVNMTVDGHKLTLEDLTAAQIESMGYTKEQAEALADLAKEARNAGGDFNTLIDDILSPKKTGRELFLEGLENVLMAILTPLKAVAGAFEDVFAFNSDELYELIKGFNEFSKAIVMSEEDAEKLRQVFKGLFSIIHLLATGFGKTLTFALKAANTLLKPFGTNVLDIAANVGEAIYQFDQWISSGTAFEDVLNGIGDILSWIIDPLKSFVGELSKLPGVSTVLGAVQSFFDKILGYFSKFKGLNPGEIFQELLRDVQNVFNRLRSLSWRDVVKIFTDLGTKIGEAFKNLVEDAKEVGPDIIEGLQNGLTDGIEGILKFLQELAEKIINAVKDILGIHSPSTVFFEIGKNIIEGLVNGIKYLSGEVAEVIHDIVDDIKYALSGVDWDIVLPIAGGIGAFAILYQMTDALQGFATAAKQFSSPFQSISNLGGSLKTTVDGFNNMMGFTQNNTSIKFKQTAEGIKILAESIAILAGSVAALTLVDQSKLTGAVVAIGALAAIIGVLAWALNKFAAGGTVLESLQLNTTLLSLGAAFALLAASAKILSGIDDAGLKNATEMITLFASVVTALLVVSAFGGSRIGTATQFLTKIGTAFLLLSVAARLLGGMDRTSMNSAQEMIMTFAAVVTALLVVSAFGGSKIGAATRFLSQVGTAFLLLGVAARLLGGMDAGSMRSAQEMLLSFAGIVGALMILVQFGGAKAGAATQFLSQVGIAFLALGVAARLLGGLSKDEIENAKSALTAFVGVISVLMLIGSLSKGVSKGVATSILSMSLAIGILAGVAVLLGYVDLEGLNRGVAIVTIFGLLVSLMAQSARGVRDIKGTMVGIAVAIGVMAAAVAVLSFIRPDKLYAAAGALSFLILSLSATIASSGKAATKVGPILAILAVVSAAAAALGILAQMDSQSVVSSAIGLSAVMLALAGALRIMDDVYSISGDAYKGLIVLTGITALLAVILGTMSAIGVEGSIGSAVALGVLINALAVALNAIEGVSNLSTKAYVGMLALTGITALLGIVLGAMNGLNPGASIANALSLSVLVNALAVALNLIAGVKNISADAYTGLGALTIVAAGMAVILSYMNGLDPAGSIANAIALSVLVNALVIAATILGAASAVIGAAVSSIGPLAAVMGGLTLIVAALGALALMPGVTQLVESGGGLLQALGDAIGSFVGGIVAGFGEAATSTLPQIGQNLSDFAKNLQPFIDAMSSIDSGFSESMGAFATGLLALTGAGVLDALTSLFGGESGIQSLSKNLPMFGEALAGFAKSLEGANMLNVSLGAQAFKDLAEAMAAIPSEGGLFGMILGGKDYSGFAKGMESIADGLVAFDEKTTGLQVDTIGTRVDALKTVMEALSNVPNTGGWLQMLLGEQNWENYSSGMGAMGEGLKAFDEKTSGLNTDGIAERVNALKTVMEALSAVPNTGGFLQQLLGQQDFSGFASGMTQMGLGLWNFGYYTREITDFEQFNGVVSCLQTLISGLSGIPSTGGWLDKIFGDGDVDYEKFASGLVAIGKAVGDFSDETSGIEDATQLGAVVSATKSLMNGLSEITSTGGLLDKMMSGDNGFNSTFSTSLSSLGSAVAGYANTVAGTKYSDVGPSITAARTILNFINDTAEIKTSGVTSFKEAVDTLATVNIAGMIEAFSAASGDFAEVGKSLIQAVADGIGDNQSSAVNAAKNAIKETKSSADDKAKDFKKTGETISTEVADGVKSKGGNIKTQLNTAISNAKSGANVSGFYSVGVNIVNGLTKGITDYAGKVASAARQMVIAAKNAANAAADSHSPSRVFRYQVAAYMGQGMVLGLEDYHLQAEKAGFGLGRSAVKGVSDTISMLSEVLNSDLDVNPTIRPVLDLSDIKNGANYINNTLGDLAPVSTLNRVATIDRSMNSRIQNGSIDDVVNAVEKLKTSISELSRPTYNVNGITYDDGSAIASAVEGLVRATRIERRM